MFEFTIRNKIKNLCKNSRRDKRFLSMDKIYSVLLVFETSDYEVVDAFVEHLEKMGKKLKGYGYKVKDDKYDYSETPYRIIVSKIDTNKSGVPDKKLLEEFSRQQCDVLIDLTINENITLEYLVASSDIPLKVGLKKNKLPVYDLAISKLPKNKDGDRSGCIELSRQVLHYLTTIHSA